MNDDFEAVTKALNELLDRRGYKWDFTRKIVLRGTLAALHGLIETFEAEKATNA